MDELKDGGASAAEYDDFGLLDLLVVVGANWKVLLLAPLIIGALAFAATYLSAPVYLARTVVLPTHEDKTLAAAAQLVAAAPGLTEMAAKMLKAPADLYVSLAQSANVQDRLVAKYELQRAYGSKHPQDARLLLSRSTHASVDRRNGLITIEVRDGEPQRAADLANAYVEELRHLVADLTLAGARERKEFFAKQLELTRRRLAEAQQSLASTGSPVAGPRPSSQGDGTARAYAERYQEVKYQEGLLSLYAQQYELAQIDETRGQASLRVIDAAAAPQRPIDPKRLSTALLAFAFSAMAGLCWAAVRVVRARVASSPATAARLARLRAAFRRS